MLAQENESLRLYLNDIRGLPLLEAGEELDLSRQIEAGRRAAQQLQANPDNTQRDQLEQVVRCGQAARQRFIEANYRLVISVARQYGRDDLPLSDLIQEGNLGLIQAVDKFDYRRGCRFSTYAVHWIRRAIRGATARQTSLSISGAAWAKLGRIKQATNQILLRGGDLTVETIALQAGLQVCQVRPLLPLLMNAASLDEPIHADAEETWAEVIPAGEPEEDPASELGALLAALPPRQQQTLRLRYYGDGQTGGLSLAEVGQGLGGVTGERVRQIEREALERLRELYHQAGWI